MPGLVPQVIIGSSASPLMVTSRSNFAPSSVGSLRQRATAASQSAPFGANWRPFRYWKVVSSGAIMPARAPASIDMLQTVMRPSISSARMAAPVYSSTVPVPPPMPICAMSARMMSFADDARFERAGHVDAEGLRRALQQALRRQHVLHFAGADAECQRADCAVRGRVAIAADHGHAGLRKAQFGPDDVHDALMARMHAVMRDAEFSAVLFELRDLIRRDGIENGQRAVAGRNAVVRGRDGEIRAADFQTPLAQALKRLRRSDFMHQVQIDIDEAGRAGFFVDDVRIPDLLA